MKQQLEIKIMFALLSAIMLWQNSLNAQSPKLEYSTFLGGSSWDYGHAITVDNKGCVYIAGQVNSSNFPTTSGAYDRTANGSADVYVTKLNKDASALDYSTYIGGSGFDDTRKVFIDTSGCVYLTGTSQSSNFPATAGSLAGNSQGYFLKLDSIGSKLAYSSKWNGGEKILVDSKGYVIIMGSTDSTNFPTTSNAYSRTLSGGSDLFVAKIDISTNQIMFSSLIGGSGNEGASSMVLDSQDNIVIAGITTSQNFPLKGNTFASYSEGKSNVFVTKLTSDGTQLIFSALVGGTDNDWPFDVTVDPGDNVYVTGVTLSSDFPVSESAFCKTYKGLQDAFLFKLKSDGSQLVYSSYIGGTDQDGGRGVVIDAYGKAYITGCTRSTNFPVSTNAFDKTYNGGGSDQWAWGDPFLFVMNTNGTQADYSTYLGGSNDEEAYGIAMDKNNGIYICGVTSSTNFPTTVGAYDRTLNGGCNIYVMKFQFSNEVPAIDYLGQTLPAVLPQIFAPGSVSVQGRYEYGLTVSPEGNEIYFTADSPGDGLMVIRKINGVWGNPEVANLRKNNNWEFEAFFTPVGNKLYFTSDTNNISKFWYMEKDNGVWGKAKYLESPVNNSSVMWCTFTADETMYYGNNSNGKIHKAKLANGHYTLTENLGFNGSHPSVEPDESFFLFNSTQYGGYGRNDIFIVLKNGDGSWATPINMGDKINSRYNETCASLSPDGKYIFFSRYNEPDEKSNIYWVSSSIIDSIKKTITGINEKKSQPEGFNLHQNYPNPFNPSTVIGYQLTGVSNVKLSIFNLLGEKIKTLVDSYQSAGEHSVTWDATDNSNNPVCSGVYFYKMETSGMSFQKKMILVR
jgi:hypothetical protein